MESRLPKPIGLRKPTTATASAITVKKTIVPMDRIRGAASTLAISKNSNFKPPTDPISRDQLKLRDKTNIRQMGGGSPEPVKRLVNTSKLRRSRSACDLREISRPLKRPEPTLAPIPAKYSRMLLKKTTSTAAITSCSSRSNLTKNISLDGAISTSTTTTLKSSFANASTGDNSKGGTQQTKSITLNRKIPAYDYKARFNDLLEKFKNLKEKYDEAKAQLDNLDNLPEQYEEAQNELYNLKTELKNEKSSVECLQRQTHAQGMKINSLSEVLETTEAKLHKLTEKHQATMTEYNKMQKENVELHESNAELSETVEYSNNELILYREQLFSANIERKDLHNTIMDLRGNIRVFCRVRPPLECEEDQLLCSWNYLDECSLEIQNLDILKTGQKKLGAHTFSFDHVFHSKSTQVEVFEMVSPLIQSALDGYNICIFAYGQTGSGKTYTMDGIYNNPGVIPRTVDLLFESIENYKRLGWTYIIKVTFLEIYNEVLYDLLSNEQKDMEIRMANKNNKHEILVTNITEEMVTSANHLRQLMQIAKMNRATAATVSNERSSRSHAVTRIELTGRHTEKEETSIGTINLVDLAGSESPKTSIRMMETKNINRSLSELTNVILALLQKQDHIPYRNSKLTHLLMPSLGGNSKTLMFINVSPFQDCYVESVKSLRFAASVNSCKMIKAKKNKFLNLSGTNTT